MTRDVISEKQMENEIRIIFEENYEFLRAEGAGSLTPEAKFAALNQVLLYWRRMRDVAERVTETEVKLSLPCQCSPDGREFTIEGVVDIVREDEQTVMYDIKTHDAEYVRSNPASYTQQLNVYAHIWQSLRGQPLDGMAIIATRYPYRVKQALDLGDPDRLRYALDRWEPLINIDFDQGGVDETIADFGAVVDAIERGDFAPRDVTTLASRIGQSSKLFASEVCGYCDARYSCATYRRYMHQQQRVPDGQIWSLLQGEETPEEQEIWRTRNLQAAGGVTALLNDFDD